MCFQMSRSTTPPLDRNYKLLNPGTPMSSPSNCLYFVKASSLLSIAQFTPQKFNTKNGHIKKASPFPRPIIFGTLQPLVNSGGVVPWSSHLGMTPTHRNTSSLIFPRHGAHGSRQICRTLGPMFDSRDLTFLKFKDASLENQGLAFNLGLKYNVN